jgi:hypothetical protein
MGFILYLGDNAIGEVTDIRGPVRGRGADEGSDYKDWIPTLLDTSVQFDMQGVHDLPSDSSPRVLVIQEPFRSAWWGRLKDRLTNRPPRTFEVIRTHATVMAEYPGTVDLTVTGRVDIGIAPMSKLERVWNRICTRLAV